MQRRRRCGLLPATCRGADKGGVSLFEKEIPLPYTLPEKICIASVQLEELRRLPIATCCARQSRVERCYTTCLCSYYPLLRSRWRLCCLTDAAHPTCGCRSAYLVEVRSNHRLPKHLSMRRAQQCRYFASSLPPSKRHSRLTTVRRGWLSGRDSQGFMAKPCTPHPHCAARAAIQAANCQCRGSRGPPLAFLWGFKGGILFGKRIPPLVSRRARRSPSRAYAGKGAALSGYPSLRAARGKHLRPCGRKKRAPLRVLFFKSLRISRTGTSGRLRR